MLLAALALPKIEAALADPTDLPRLALVLAALFAGVAAFCFEVALVELFDPAPGALLEVAREAFFEVDRLVTFLAVFAVERSLEVA